MTTNQPSGIAATTVPLLGPTELLAHAREFVFHLLLDEHDLEDREREVIKVTWRGPDDQWAITDGFDQVLNRAGRWEYEPLPSSRTKAFRRRTRFARDEAVRRALSVVQAEQAPLAAAGFVLDARGYFAYRSARVAAKSADMEVTAARRAELDQRDQAAFDRYLTTHHQRASQ